MISEQALLNQGFTQEEVNAHIAACAKRERELAEWAARSPSISIRCDGYKERPAPPRGLRRQTMRMSLT